MAISKYGFCGGRTTPWNQFREKSRNRAPRKHPISAKYKTKFWLHSTIYIYMYVGVYECIPKVLPLKLIARHSAHVVVRRTHTAHGEIRPIITYPKWSLNRRRIVCRWKPKQMIAKKLSSFRTEMNKINRTTWLHGFVFLLKFYEEKKIYIYIIPYDRTTAQPFTLCSYSDILARFRHDDIIFSSQRSVGGNGDEWHFENEKKKLR